MVRAFGQEPRHIRRFAELNEANRAANMTTVYLNAAYFPAIEFVSALATVAILIYGGYQAIDGAITIGVIVAFIAALGNFFAPITQLSQLYTTYQSGMAALDKIFELLDVKADLVEAPDAIELGRIRGEIRFEGVTFAYATDPRDRSAAARPTVDRRAGRRATPASDCGAASRSTRSTSSSRPGRRSPWSGRREPESRRWPSWSHGSTTRPRAACSSTAMTCGTSRRRACAGRWASSPRRRSSSRGRSARTSPSAGRTRPPTRSAAAARAVGADEFIAALDNGYDTQVGERGAQISAGQRQLLAFARALIADPRILVLDEATSNVDLHTEGRIEAGLRRLLAGRTALVIAHRLSTIRAAGRIVVLDGGSDRRAGNP